MQESSIIELLDIKNKILDEIKYIEENYEGTYNSLNVEKVHKLNKEQATLMTEKSELLEKLSAIDSQLRKINSKIRTLSGEGADKILDAISEQRWFFFKNKPKVVMDKYTGILWANLEYFDFYNANNESHTFTLSEATKIVDALELDGYKNWIIPTANQMITMINDKTFPFQDGNCHRIKNLDYWFASDGENYCIDLDNYNRGQANVYLLPCNTSLTSDEYEKNITDSRIYTQTEKLQFTLNIFINNGLEPIFKEEKISELYYKVYIEKPELIKEYENVKKKIGSFQDNVMLSSVFDFSTLIDDYDLDSINRSVIKYYKAVQKWVDSFIDMLEFFESEKITLIRSFEEIADTILKNYEYELEMTEDENLVFENRRSYLQKCVTFNMNGIKSKLLAIRKNADDIESKIEDINNGENIIEELAKIEKINRVSFELLAENTINIVQNMLIRAEYFEKNKRVLTSVVNIEQSWADDYRMLKVKFKNKFKNICEKEGISSYSWSIWYRDWCLKRLMVEQLFLPLVQREFICGMRENNSEAEQIVSAVEKILNCLQVYKDNVDDFYTNKRKGVYKKCALLPDGEHMENLEVKNEIARLNSYLKGNMENIASNMKNVEDKIFIQKWIKPLVNIEI